jgi:P pilus assembly protein, pilin FimA
MSILFGVTIYFAKKEINMRFNTNVTLLRNIMTAAIVGGMAFTASAADGTINFTGTILDSACTVDTTSASQTVNLGQVSRTAFAAAGDTASPTRFNIVLNNCPETVTSAAVRFDGIPDSADMNILALGSDQTATGVGVALFESDGVTPVPLATESQQVTLNTGTGENSNVLTYVASYKATQAAVGAGSANATSDFTITYQ